MEEKELLGCPFCGGEAVITKTNYETWVSCENYHVAHHQVSMHASKEADAIAAWNTRAAVTDEQFAFAVHDGHLWKRVDESEQEREIARLEGVIKDMYDSMSTMAKWAYIVTDNMAYRETAADWGDKLRDIGLEMGV